MSSIALVIEGERPESLPGTTAVFEVCASSLRVLRALERYEQDCARHVYRCECGHGAEHHVGAGPRVVACTVWACSCTGWEPVPALD